MVTSSSQPTQPVGVFSRVDALIRRWPDMSQLSKDDETVLVITFVVFAGLALGFGVVLAIEHHTTPLDERPFDPSFSFIWSVATNLTAISSFVRGLEYAVHAVVFQPLEGLLTLVVGAAVLLFWLGCTAVFPLPFFYLYAHGSLRWAESVSLFPAAMARIVDWTLPIILFQLLLRLIGLCSSLYPYFYLCNLYVMVTAFFDLSPLSSLSSFLVRLEARILAATVPATTEPGNVASKVRMMEAELEVLKLKRRLQELEEEKAKR
ncbi:hypothetical protein JCM8097_003258 [Rhodosporidiobolus ruineniae]